jgi:hypothetical protein
VSRGPDGANRAPSPPDQLYPFSFLDDVEVRIVVDGDVSLGRWAQAIEQMGATS